MVLNRRPSTGLLSASRRHPYAIPAGRVRKNSSSSLSTCSEYSEPSPSYSVRSYPESVSPDPFFSDCNSPYVSPPNPAFRSAEREARVFERLRQLVPVLPTDRNAYQVNCCCLIIVIFYCCWPLFFLNFKHTTQKMFLQKIDLP